MAVVTRPCAVIHCMRNGCRSTPQHGWTLKSIYDFIKTQLCTIAICLTLFHSVRLPREAFKHGLIPYLVIYSFWLLIVGLPTALLQLIMGQLSQQDPVGVWRAVPILRGVGHLKILTSYLCCVYNMTLVALSSALLIWIGKGSFPLRDCTRLHITKHGYENKMNATECFNSTFLAPFTLYPEYLGVMAILVFILWFFIPILLYRLHKSLKVAFNILTPITIIFAIVLCTFLADSNNFTEVLKTCQQWILSNSYIWHSALVQALLSTQIVSGYFISAGGTIYRHSDVRWTASSITIANLAAGWLWVMMWQSIGGDDEKDKSFVAVLVLIYQSSVLENRDKKWPILGFGLIFLSGIITVLTLLFPIYDKLHRLTGDHWRMFAIALSAVGTAITVTVLTRGLEVVTILDDLVVPMLAVFTTIIEVVAFVFIYGWCHLTGDIIFLTGTGLPCICVVIWWIIPFLMLGITGWWLRTLIRATWGQAYTLWPLVGVFIGILVVMVVMAAVAVAKEEQFNLLSKIASAFKPSRLWGPEEPMARYVWMSQRYSKDALTKDNVTSDTYNNYPQIIPTKGKEKIYSEDWLKDNAYQITDNGFSKDRQVDKADTVFRDIETVYSTHSIPRSKKKKKFEKFRSPNICIAKLELGGQTSCDCNRHFKLNVPNLRNNEVTTSL